MQKGFDANASKPFGKYRINFFIYGSVSSEGKGISWVRPKLKICSPETEPLINQFELDGLKTAASIFPSPS